MSHDASRWAWLQACHKSSCKLVLLALSDRAGTDHCAYPSVETISNDTELNRKTVIAALHSLTELGLIQDTGMRKGKSGRVIVYQLIGVISRDEERKRQSQKRDDTKNGTIPKTDCNSTENGTLNSTENGTQNLSVEPVRGTDTKSPGGDLFQREDLKPKTHNKSVPYQKIADLFNRIIHNDFPRVKVVNTKDRQNLIKKFWKHMSEDLSRVEAYFDYFNKNSTSHQRGENDRGWVANIDFICREDVITRCREGSL